MKHTGLLSSGFTRLPHYFTPYQAFVACGAELETIRFPMDSALLVLQREAEYRAEQPQPPGLFVYQFEVMSRNRLGYDDGLRAMAADPFYDKNWSAFMDDLRRQVGIVDFADILYLRSEWYVRERRRQEPDYEPPLPPLFGEKEGKIARATTSAIRSTCSPPCKDNSITPRRRGRRRATTWATRWRRYRPGCVSWRSD